MDLMKSCEDGQISVKDFLAILERDMPAPMRAQHLVQEGDYALTINSLVPNVIAFERVAAVNSPERGDFVTDKGTSGPIQGGVFLSRKLRTMRPYTLLEGDRVNPGQGSVYDQIRGYQSRVMA